MNTHDNDIIDAGPVHRIESLRLGDSPYTLVISYSDGAELETDMTGIIHKLDSLAPLRAADAFAACHVVFHGAGVEWDTGQDFSADALRHLAEAQQDMTGADFVAWMDRMKISNNEAADAFGAVVRTIKVWRAKKADALPPTVTIACRAMERDRLLLLARVRPHRPGRPRTPANQGSEATSRG